MKLFFTIMVAALLIVACSSSKNNSSTSSPSLNGSWQLTYVSGARVAFDALYPDKKPFITFKLDSMQVGGNNSCNGFGGKFSLDKNKIKFENLIQTMMACQGEGESIFKKALEQADSYKFEDDNLLIIANEVTVMKFRRMTDTSK